jgi:hypothetical protein
MDSVTRQHPAGVARSILVRSRVYLSIFDPALSSQASSNPCRISTIRLNSISSGLLLAS